MRGNVMNLYKKIFRLKKIIKTKSFNEKLENVRIPQEKLKLKEEREHFNKEVKSDPERSAAFTELDLILKSGGDNS